MLPRVTVMAGAKLADVIVSLSGLTHKIFPMRVQWRFTLLLCPSGMWTPPRALGSPVLMMAASPLV